MSNLQILLALACAASCANLILILATHRPVVFLASYVLEIAALLVAPVLVSLNHHRTRASSSVILLFWPLYTLGVLVWARTSLTISPVALLPVVILRCAVTLLGLAAFAVECYGPEFATEDRPEYFMWMDRLMQKGASEYITEDDLPALLPHDEASQLGDRLKKAMNKQYVYDIRDREYCS